MSTPPVPTSPQPPVIQLGGSASGTQMFAYGVITGSVLTAVAVYLFLKHK